VTKRYEESIEVEMGASTALGPVAFLWRGRRYCVNRLLKYWREAGEGWDPQRAKDHECYRVEAEGGTYDLRFDRLSGQKKSSSKDVVRWKLARVWD